MVTGLFRFLKITFALFGALSFLYFAVMNREVVAIDLAPLPFILEIRLFLFVGLALLAGSLLGWAVAYAGYLRKLRQLKQKARRAEALEAENQALRLRPILPAVGEHSHG